jgi:hypothetical protein
VQPSERLAPRKSRLVRRHGLLLKAFMRQRLSVAVGSKYRLRGPSSTVRPEYLERDADLAASRGRPPRTHGADRRVGPIMPCNPQTVKSYPPRRPPNAVINSTVRDPAGSEAPCAAGICPSGSWNRLADRRPPASVLEAVRSPDPLLRAMIDGPDRQLRRRLKQAHRSLFSATKTAMSSVERIPTG